MPWYKISISHGPGHQSHSEKYVWSDTEATKDDKREWFDDFARDQYMDWPIGKVRKCALPEQERLSKIAAFKGNSRHCQYMLNVLGADPSPQLVPVELVPGSNENEHINTEKQYLVRYGGNLYAGRFMKVWFGWTFAPGWGASTMQLDGIERVWEFDTSSLPKPPTSKQMAKRGQAFRAAEAKKREAAKSA